MKWNDKQGHRDRRAWCLLIGPGNTIRVFTGESIPGVVAVTGEDYCKQGKWSSSTYEMTLAPGVSTITGHDGWETGTFVEGLGLNLAARRWVNVANRLGVSVPVAMDFLKTWRPKAAEVLDRIEADLESVDTAAGKDGATETIISFGCPTNRQIGAGYWESPIIIEGDGETVEIPAAVWYEKQGAFAFAHPKVRILSVEHRSGMHGGYYSIRLAIPAGWKAVFGFGKEGI